MQYKVAKAEKSLNRNNYQLSCEHEDFTDGGVDTLICQGEKNWRVPVKCSMRGYGMFVATWLFDLGHYIGFVQLYEHARGGHTDPTITIIDHESAVYSTIDRYAGEFETAVFDENYLYLRHRDARKYRAEELPNFTGTCIMQIELKTGKVLREIPVQTSEKFFSSQRLLQAWLNNVGLSSLQVAFAEAALGVVLDISVVNYQRVKGHAYESLQIPFVDFLANAV